MSCWREAAFARVQSIFQKVLKSRELQRVSVRALPVRTVGVELPYDPKQVQPHLQALGLQFVRAVTWALPSNIMIIRASKTVVA